MNIFITAIDTDAGKSVVTGLLARELQLYGCNIITAKLAQTGCVSISDDIVTHRQLMGIDLLPDDENGSTCPYLFPFPASPHLAARLAGSTIKADVLHGTLNNLEANYQWILTEGAGGLMVPLSDSLLTIDFVSERKMPVVLVTSSRLGSINHTLLSIEACYNRQIDIIGVVFNHFPLNDELIANESVVYIKRYLTAKYPNATWAEIPVLNMLSHEYRDSLFSNLLARLGVV
jgi:dethiobiotin synthetase